MTSIYYTPPVPLVPNTIAQSGVLNNDFSVGVDNAFIAVAADVVKRLGHASISFAAMTAAAIALAGKMLGIDGTGLVLAATQSYGIFRGTWVTATNYNKGDVIRDNRSHALYLALAYFQSSASVATDVANGNLQQVVGLSPGADALPVTSQPGVATNFTAVAGNAYLYTVAASPVTVKLPTSASSKVGDAVELVVSAAVNFTVVAAPQGADLINGLNANALIYNVGLSHGARFIYSGPIFGWIIMWVH